MAIILWAHRRFSSRVQTHYAPFPPSRAAGVTAASSPQSTRRGQALPPDLRRTRPTLTKIALPDRLQPKLPFLPAPLLVPPYGVNPLPAGGQGRQRRRQERHQPDSLPSFAPPSSTKNKMRPAMPAPRQKAATLRRARCFGFGRQGTQRKGSAATAVYIFSGMPLPRCLTCPSALPPVPKALRPPLHLSKRMAGSRGALPQMRDSVRPLCV
jgi:hypothetical protein